MIVSCHPCVVVSRDSCPRANGSPVPSTPASVSNSVEDEVRVFLFVARAVVARPSSASRASPPAPPRARFSLVRFSKRRRDAHTPYLVHPAIMSHDLVRHHGTTAIHMHSSQAHFNYTSQPNGPMNDSHLACLLQDDSSSRRPRTSAQSSAPLYTTAAGDKPTFARAVSFAGLRRQSLAPRSPASPVAPLWASGPVRFAGSRPPPR